MKLKGANMILSSQSFYAERGKRSETYQLFTATMEMSGDWHYITVELDHLTRWRSAKEYASFLRWDADEIMKLPTPAVKALT